MRKAIQHDKMFRAEGAYFWKESQLRKTSETFMHYSIFIRTRRSSIRTQLRIPVIESCFTLPGSRRLPNARLS